MSKNYGIAIAKKSTDGKTTTFMVCNQGTTPMAAFEEFYSTPLCKSKKIRHSCVLVVDGNTTEGAQPDWQAVGAEPAPAPAAE